MRALGWILVSALAVTPSWADTIDLPADRDNTLYGVSGISNGAGERLFAGATAMLSLRRGIIHFDVAGALPAGSTILNVEFKLNMVMTITGGTPVSLHRVQADWGEGTSDAAGPEGGGTVASAGDCTWDNTFFPTDLWATPGGDFDASASATTTVAGNAQYTWTGTDAIILDVQDWLDNPTNNFGWVIMGDESTATTAKAYASRENPDVTLRPVLTIEFDPGVVTTEFRRGDCNNDGGYDISDAIAGLSVLFSGTGPAACIDACDANDDGGFDIADMIFVLGNLFSMGPAPVDPGTSQCGVDPTMDSLDCLDSACP